MLFDPKLAASVLVIAYYLLDIMKQMLVSETSEMKMTVIKK